MPASPVPNLIHHALTGRIFFLLPDEDPAEFEAHEARWLAEWRPRDLAEQDAAELAIRGLWRETRADRLEAQLMADLFAAEAIEEEVARRAAKAAAMKALATLLRYRAQIGRESETAMRALNALGRRRLTTAPAVPQAEPAAAPGEPVRDEPERLPNRHERRALAAIERRRIA